MLDWLRHTPLLPIALLILTPTGVSCAQERLTGAHRAAPDVLVVTVESGPHPEDASYENPIRTDANEWRVNGQRAKSVHLYSLPWDQEFGKKDVTVLHRVFLRLSEPVKNETPVHIQTPHGDKKIAFSDTQTLCESIKVNQVGYNAGATSRYANFGVYMGDGGSLRLSKPPSYRVTSVSTGKTVFSGTGIYMADDTDPKAVSSGEHVYRLPLNTVPEGGPYYVVVEGCGRSPAFGIGRDYSREIAKVLTRGLFHQRCGIALDPKHTEHPRDECHTQVGDTRSKFNPEKPFIKGASGAPQMPIRGGYHDAADFDRRPTHLIIPVTMLSYYEAFPQHFVDGQYDIPESGNGIPDFLDEALWSLKSWEYLQVTDAGDPEYGGVRSGTEAGRHPDWGVTAAQDELAYGTWEITKEATATAAGVFAHASRMLKPYDAERSAALLERARLGWQFLEKRKQTAPPTTALMYAALQLYLATGEQSFHKKFSHVARAIVLRGGPWPEQYSPGNWEAKATTSHFFSYLITERAVEENLRKALSDRIFQVADRGTYMGPRPEKEPYPKGVSKFLGWGSGTGQGRYADAYMFAWRLTQDPSQRELYFNAASQYADYALGLNPMGTSYVTGLGTWVPRSPLHLDSYFSRKRAREKSGNPQDHSGDVPGIAVYGPAQGRSMMPYQRVVSDKLYPGWDELPPERRWGHGWSLVNGNEFTVDFMLWGVVLHGFLYDASQDPSLPGEKPVNSWEQMMEWLSKVTGVSFS